MRAERQLRLSLEAKPGRVQLVPPELGDFPETSIWSFGGGVPGPLIRAWQGDVLQRRLINSLPQPTAVHWHGLRIPNAMDGVPGLTQDPVPPGGEFLYEFRLKDAGTYWYHSHNQSTEQVARGHYGVMVVDEAEAPEVDQDIVVVLDDYEGRSAQKVGFSNPLVLRQSSRFAANDDFKLFPKCCAASELEQVAESEHCQCTVTG
ncbi:multicopper oxidase domain-containing protein [Phaeobacter gallaeciensis]|uniref:multicopper oxidase domain-containing protein n=1 Tax=Phaeobacter gallaeciensis TaxID=60890 RepID=UPI00237F1D68|nr:multicopper oxidase domain-containing protein [Phaeobacter gallaeciensis]MDE4099707.1 multicopper oxidase domain-containing protein [Phaeobacter gallaeciensis]MDE4108558.1 multicopper oxidase domain-containing protein [Phaeobacter gallaeciensis]MDE4110426.1 multicopper oxidase domain-containing protein [Phaeobacter gallaeciensis]MDE4117348.1 multicopper oxidase domain-containing protein [Phaeobacter gallaeciensis]MDE4121821.1 multicopper oxidase domain-containing protein [Phaeobacter gallae